MVVKCHPLDGEVFQKALERYVDENKPDPLVLQQIKGWEMQWSSSSKEEEPLLPVDDDSSSSLFTPTDCLEGALTWKNDYMVAEIQSLCCWQATTTEGAVNSESNRKTGGNGSLYFVMRAKLRFRNKHDKKKADDHSSSKEERHANDKVHQKMIQRLKEDTAIKRLLEQGDNNKMKEEDGKKKGDTEDAGAVLCEARVSVSNNNDNNSNDQSFEERVDVTDNVAESLRRALFSQTESSLDVIEVLLSLPLLPCSIHQITGIQCVSSLADRAKLRLLEDAMFDACEREGEDELIDELTISSDNNNNTDDGDAPPVVSKQAKHAKAQQQSRSNKRTKR